MAYAALTSLAQTIDLILNYHQDFISPRLKNQTISINKYVIFLQVFLDDFPDKANSLEGRIMEATHGAEDIIELLTLEHIHELRCVKPSNSKSKLQPKGKYKQLRYDFQDLKVVAKEIESIAEKAMDIKNSVTVEDVRDPTAASSLSSVVPIHKYSAMVGFDDDLMKIKSRLCGESSSLGVIPIVGMGGIGKTTLARTAYDDPLIVEYFDIRAWITVSQNYNAHEIASDLLVSMKVLDTKNDSFEEKVHKVLKKRRYLIVVDDIWSVNAWDDLMMMFPDDCNGSRIMLTTRLSDVASYVNSCGRVHEMRLMDVDQSWNLLRKKVFQKGHCPDELEYVGKMIAKCCRGLPLAIVVISGLLIVDQTKAAWEKISKDVKYAISANDDQFDKILSLSYTHLPHHLRPCFLYMAAFPEDYEMHVSRLVKLWVAEGFLKLNSCHKSFEETGEEYLEDLVKRSLVLVKNRKSNGKIKSLSIHDSIREMCIRKAKEENFFQHVHKFLAKDINIMRRLSVSKFDRDFLEYLYGSTIRTLICMDNVRRDTRCSSAHFRLLQILDLVNAFEFFDKDESSNAHLFLYDSHRFVPAVVFELFHLRYLALDYPYRIPPAISNLQNLQTLMIGQGKYHALNKPCFVELPVAIWRMPQLRHLILFCRLVPFQQDATFVLENLQTLSEARNFICSKEILKLIPNLKKLGISYTLQKEGSTEIYEEDYQLSNLKLLQHLEKLRLSVDDGPPCPEKINPAFPMTLKKLTLHGLRLPWEDMKIIGSLPNLEVLKLRHYACDGDTWETAEGEFLQLKYLLIDESELQCWITESSHFPTLKCLVFRRCWYLRVIPDDIGEVPSLESIEVDHEYLLYVAEQIQDYQRSCGNDALQVRLVNVRSSHTPYHFTHS